METEFYSWRVSRDLKTMLEREARRRKTSLSAVLRLAAAEWVQKSTAEDRGDDEQRLLQAAASKCFGAFAGGDSRRSETVRDKVRERLRGLHDR